MKAWITVSRMTDKAPDASGQIDIDAGTGKVYALITDLNTLASLAGEYTGHRWLGGSNKAAVGAKFIGKNRLGWRRWVTIAKVTDAEDGKRFAFDVGFGPMPVARWQYDIEPQGAGCRVTESTWDRRPRWTRRPLGVLLGVKDRASHNRININATLDRLKQRAEVP